MLARLCSLPHGTDGAPWVFWLLAFAAFTWLAMLLFSQEPNPFIVGTVAGLVSAIRVEMNPLKARIAALEAEGAEPLA